jgi:hypothetical protein
MGYLSLADHVVYLCQPTRWLSYLNKLLVFFENVIKLKIHTSYESQTCLPAKKNLLVFISKIVKLLGTSNIDVSKWLFHYVTPILHMIAKKIALTRNLKKDRCYTNFGGRDMKTST